MFQLRKETGSCCSKKTKIANDFLLKKKKKKKKEKKKMEQSESYSFF